MAFNNTISPAQILKFLEVEENEKPDFPRIQNLMTAFRMKVPFETITRILRFRKYEQGSEQRIRLPGQLWDDILYNEGSGATCSEAHLAFHELLTSVGFKSALVLDESHSHCCLSVNLSGRAFAVDVCRGGALFGRHCL